MAFNVYNQTAHITASPHFLARLAKTGLFSMKLVYGCGDKSIVEIRFVFEEKLPKDWTSKIILFDR